jgi:hypothetical protein
MNTNRNFALVLWSEAEAGGGKIADRGVGIAVSRPQTAVEHSLQSTRGGCFVAERTVESFCEDSVKILSSGYTVRDGRTRLSGDFWRGCGPASSANGWRLSPGASSPVPGAASGISRSVGWQDVLARPRACGSALPQRTATAWDHTHITGKLVLDAICLQIGRADLGSVGRRPQRETPVSRI